MKFIKLTFKDFTEITYTADKITEKAIQREFSFKMNNFYVVAANKPWMKKDPNSGLVRIIDNKVIPIGMLDDILKLAKRQGSEVIFTNKDKFRQLRNNVSHIDKSVLKSYVSQAFLDSIGGEFYDFQYAACKEVLKNKCGTVDLHPGAGKSLIIFSLIAYLNESLCNDMFSDSKIVISVPSISLVEQMFSDISEYCNGKFDDMIGLIYSQSPKKYKDWTKTIIITTHNSLKTAKKYHSSIKAIIVDEAHELKCGDFKNSKMNETIHGLKNAEYRIGLSGSFIDIENDAKANKLEHYRVKQNFGKTLIKVDYDESITNKRLTQFEIENLFYDYQNEDDKYRIAYSNYANTNTELVLQEDRPKIMKHLIDSGKIKSDDNTFIVFFFKDSLDQFHKYLTENYPEYEYFVIKGEVKGKTREQYRQYVSKHKGCILLGTYKTISRGINVKNLNNIIIVDGMKVKDGIKQIIGRVLRLAEGKEKSMIYFLVDNSWLGNKMGVLMKQAMERMQQFITEKWKFRNIFINKNLEEYHDEKITNKINNRSIR